MLLWFCAFLMLSSSCFVVTMKLLLSLLLLWHRQFVSVKFVTIWINIVYSFFHTDANDASLLLLCYYSFSPLYLLFTLSNVTLIYIKYEFVVIKKVLNSPFRPKLDPKLGKLIYDLGITNNSLWMRLIGSEN